MLRPAALGCRVLPVVKDFKSPVNYLLAGYAAKPPTIDTHNVVSKTQPAAQLGPLLLPRFVVHRPEQFPINTKRAYLDLSFAHSKEPRSFFWRYASNTKEVEQTIEHDPTDRQKRYSG